MEFIKLDWKPHNEVLGAFIISNDFINTTLSKGTHNGYIILGILHPYYGLDYDEIDLKLDEQCLNVPHGGITFGKPIFDFKNQSLQNKLNKLNKLYPELKGINYMVLGFDTCHCGDNAIIWNQEAVEKETIQFAETMTKISFNCKESS